MGYIRRNIVRPMTKPISVNLDSETATTARPQTSVSAVMMIETIKPVKPVETSLNQTPTVSTAYQQRNLWTDNVWRTRSFYISYLHDFNDLAATRSFLDQNLRDIGDSIKPYYGNGAGDRLRDALNNRLVAFVDVVESVKKAPAGFDLSADPVLGQRLLTWTDRYNSFFDVFASLNPAVWNKLEIRNLIDNDRDFWWNQLQARHKNEWVRDLTFLDYSFDNAVKMAGMVLSGIPT